jgi:hypothetical protein
VYLLVLCFIHYRISLFNPQFLAFISAVHSDCNDKFGKFITKLSCLTINTTNTISQRQMHPPQPPVFRAAHCLRGRARARARTHTHTQKHFMCETLTPKFVEIFRCDAQSLYLHIFDNIFFCSFLIKSKKTFHFTQVDALHRLKFPMILL